MDSRAEQFQYWLAHMDDALAAFSATLPAALRDRLDGSIGSLDALEAWLLERFAGVAAAQQPAQSAVLDGAARYVGEVLRRGSGSTWALETKDPKFAYDGLPILKGGKLGRTPECPLSLVTASLDRRNGTYLSTVARNICDEPAAA